MNKIIAKKSVSEDLVKFEIRTSINLGEIKPGQYILLTTEKNETGFPLPVVKTNPENGTITVLVYAADKATRQLAELKTGSELVGLDGPFGHPAQIENFGTVLCVARGPGIVPLLPVVYALSAAGNRIVTILSAQTMEGILLENEIRVLSAEVLTYTDDGSCGVKGPVCHAMGKVLKFNRFDQVVAMGSAKTIKEICTITILKAIPEQAFLYLERTEANKGHGIFKVSICGNAKAVCVDGFNFNAYYPGFEEMVKRFGCKEETAFQNHAANRAGIPA